MSTPPGWYADPYPAAPGTPPLQRWWDGRLWTGHVAPIAAGAPGGPATTPDGAPLSGWWLRVGAAVIDAFVLFLVLLVVAFPLFKDMLDAVRDLLTTVTESDQDPSLAYQTTFEVQLRPLMLDIGLVSLALNFVYHVGFLLWKQATPGKLALGLRVRLRERPELPLRTILVRWGVQSGAPGLLGLIPFVGSFFSLFTLLDGLWPLWDPHKQAIHDKAARTNVVRVR